MTLFDLIAVAVLLVSALIGWARGAVRELATVFAFGLAALVAVVALPAVAPLARDVVRPAWAASSAGAVVVFVTANVLLKLAAGWLTKRLHASTELGVVDRSIGLGFGVVRAVIVLGVFYLAFSVATPPELAPDWFTKAKLQPLARASAAALSDLAPDGARGAGRLGPMLKRALADTPGADNRIDEGYDAGTRQGIDSLVERTQ